jgi:hypothetical protein
VQELRKASGQQLREVQVVQGEAVKQLQDERQQAERKEAQLKVSYMCEVSNILAMVSMYKHLGRLSVQWCD